MTDFPLSCVIKFPLANLRLKKILRKVAQLKLKLLNFKNTSTVVKVDCGANLPCLGHSPSVLLDL